jgi:hypothetical protein
MKPSKMWSLKGSKGQFALALAVVIKQDWHFPSSLPSILIAG